MKVLFVGNDSANLSQTLREDGHTVDCLSENTENFLETASTVLGAETLICRVTDPNFFIKNVRYGIKDDAVFIGVSECCGLKKTMIKNPLYTTSYGVGEVISLARKLNKKRVFLGLGGGAVNDCGAGIVCALGGRFFDKTGEEITPVGNTLCDIATMDLTDFYNNIEGMTFTVLYDEDYFLTGENGCVARSAESKGAKGADSDILEKNVEHFAEITSVLGVNPDFVGSGAGGGLGYCFKAFFKGEVVPYKEFLLQNIQSKMENCDCLLISEGNDGFVKKAEELGKTVFFEMPTLIRFAQN